MVRTCGFRGCEGVYYANGLCHNHYERARRGTLGKPEVDRPAHCTFNGCGNENYCKDLCRGHYSQHYRGLALTPLRSRLVLQGSEKGRVCTTCNTFKEWDEFYNRRARCKVCTIKANTITNRKRQGGSTTQVRARVYAD